MLPEAFLCGVLAKLNLMISAEASSSKPSPYRPEFLGDGAVGEDPASIRVYLEDQVQQKTALMGSISLKVSQMENKVFLQIQYSQIPSQQKHLHSSNSFSCMPQG